MECVLHIKTKMEMLMNTMLFCLGILNLDKVSTLKSKIGKSQFQNDLPVLTNKGCGQKYPYLTIPIVTSQKLLLPFQS